MKKHAALDLLFITVFLSLVLINQANNHEQAYVYGSATVTIMTPTNLAGLIVLAPSIIPLPRTLAGIVFVMTLIVGLLALDFYYSGNRRRMRGQLQSDFSQLDSP